MADSVSGLEGAGRFHHVSLHSHSRNRIRCLTALRRIFSVFYIPVINNVVFKRVVISWEWGVVFVSSGLFSAGVEAWKWGKRIIFRRMARNSDDTALGDNESKVFGRYLTVSSMSGDDKEKGVN